MVQMTMQVSDDLAKRILPMRPWLPAVIELGLVGCKTPATETAAEIIQYLSKNPSPGDVLEFQVSERAQTRIQRLLVLNKEGMLGENEQHELDELQKIEHVIILLKSQIAGQLQSKEQCH